MPSGINGKCDQPCRLGRPHELDCRNYIEVDLPCPVCNTGHGRHEPGCILNRHRPNGVNS